MKRLGWFAGTAVLAASIAWAIYHAGGPTGPPLGVISPSTQPVTVAPGSSKVVATYQIRNGGGEDLILDRVETTCGCTSATVEPKVLKPGQGGVITVEGTPYQTGERSVQVRLTSNSRPVGDLILTLVMVGPAKEIPFVANSSGPILFGPIRPGASETFQVEAIERKDQPPWIDRAVSTVECVDLKGGFVEEQEVEGLGVLRTYRYHATVAKAPRIGPLQGEVAFMGRGSAGQAVHKLSVSGLMRAPVFATPSSLFASSPGGEAPPRLSLMLAADNPEFRLETSAKVEGSDVLTITRLGRFGKMEQYEVTPTGALDESIGATVVFRTNHPDAAEVRVPVSIKK